MALPVSCKTLPASGTLSNGTFFPLKRRVRLTAVRGFSSSPGCPTPMAHDAGKGNPARVGRYGTVHGGRNLNDWAARYPQHGRWGTGTSPELYPTPSASSYGANKGGAAGRVGKNRPSLETMARHALWPASLPTPLAGDAMGATGNWSGNARKVWRPTLSCMARRGLWPTPTATDATSGPGHGRGYEGSTNLRTAVARPSHREQWPTPTVKGNHANKDRGTDEGDGLATAVVREAAFLTGKLLPTPTVQDSANNGPPSQHRRRSPPLNAVAGGPLNPRWVAWLMGFPIGWTDLEPLGMPSFLWWLREHSPPSLLERAAMRREALTLEGFI